MHRFIAAVLILMPVLGFGQSAKYILDGNDEVRSSFLTPSNASIFAGGLSSSTNTFLINSLRIGPQNQLSVITLDTTNGIVFGGIAPASANPLASITRANLGLGWSALTKTNAIDFRYQIELGETNSVNFKQLNIGDNYSYNPTNGALSIAGVANVSIRPGGIYFSDSGLAQPGIFPASANQTRTNLGLGATWLTNTNAASFRSAIELGATWLTNTNATSFRNAIEAAPSNHSHAFAKVFSSEWPYALYDGNGVKFVMTVGGSGDVTYVSPPDYDATDGAYIYTQITNTWVFKAGIAPGNFLTAQKTGSDPYVGGTWIVGSSPWSSALYLSNIATEQEITTAINNFSVNTIYRGIFTPSNTYQNVPIVPDKRNATYIINYTTTSDNYLRLPTNPQPGDQIRFIVPPDPIGASIHIEALTVSGGSNVWTNIDYYSPNSGTLYGSYTANQVIDSSSGNSEYYTFWTKDTPSSVATGNEFEYLRVGSSNSLLGINIDTTNGISFDGVAPASANQLASSTRSNLGLGWAALTKTNDTDFRYAINLGETNLVNFKQLDIGAGYSYNPSNGAISVAGGATVSIRQEGIYFSDSALQQPGVLPSSANQTRTNLGLTWSGLTNSNASSFQVALFNSNSLNAQGQRITNLATPVNDSDAATKAYVFGLFNRVAPTVSFVNTTGTVEIGFTVPSVSLSWTISPTNTTVSSQTLTGSQGTVSAITATNMSATASTNFTSDTTWTLIVNDGTGLPGGIVTNTTSIAFRHYLSWGISASTNLNNTQIRNLHTNAAVGAGREFRTSKGRSVTIDGSGQYIYFAYPTNWGAASFLVNNLPNTAWISNVVTYTNASGNASQFYIYRSTDVQNGIDIPITIN